MMKINSHNEWDGLREIIVGRGDGRAYLEFPDGMPSEELLVKAQHLAQQAYPQWLVDEINEDLEGLCVVLKSFGVKVYRPNTARITQPFSTPYFSAVGNFVYDMRDLHLVVGNKVIESPSQEKHRYFEATGLSGNHMEVYYADGKSQYEDGQKFIRLAENEILFEAANTLRMGKDLLYLVSRSGNFLGARWLQNVLGDEYRVHRPKKKSR